MMKENKARKYWMTEAVEALDNGFEIEGRCEDDTVFLYDDHVNRTKVIIENYVPQPNLRTLNNLMWRYHGKMVRITLTVLD